MIIFIYRFQQKSDADLDWISIEKSFIKSSSKVGRQGGKQIVWLGPKAFDDGICVGDGLYRYKKAHGRAMHELMHVLGK